ncbi:CidA/LrgA family protein [Brevibacillus fulvus]|uniref:Holin-like protein n=1 Tax=Brevibacillus fulvus TaxID=1125967 RepID=A0A939BW18_9BACL|nr:CidA/LrgA family protein [Brevibacillus fulvus]MBM7591994.1 holin-like protein [Brevibacillus fulvus]
MKIVKILVQVAIMVLFTVVGDLLAKWFHLSVPGSMIGMLLLFIALQLKWIKLEWVELGGNFLLAEMLLFFVPSAVGIVQYQSLIVSDGSRIMFVILLSTIIVMALTGISAEYVSRIKEGKKDGERQHRRAV